MRAGCHPCLLPSSVRSQPSWMMYGVGYEVGCAAITQRWASTHSFQSGAATERLSSLSVLRCLLSLIFFTILFTISTILYILSSFFSSSLFAATIIRCYPSAFSVAFLPFLRSRLTFPFDARQVASSNFWNYFCVEWWLAQWQIT